MNGLEAFLTSTTWPTSRRRSSPIRPRGRGPPIRRRAYPR